MMAREPLSGFLADLFEAQRRVVWAALWLNAFALAAPLAGIACRWGFHTAYRILDKKREAE